MKPLLCFLLATVFLACQTQELTFHIQFRNPGGLRPGDRVLLDSREIGRVEKLQQSEDGNWQVMVKVDATLRDRITQGSSFTLAPDPDIPRRFSIRISPAPNGRPIRDGAVVQGSESPASVLAPFFKGLSQGLETLQRQFGEFTRELERLPRSPEYLELQRQLEELTHQMRQAEEKMQRELLPQLQKELDRLQKELEKIHPRGKPPADDERPIEL